MSKVKQCMVVAMKILAEKNVSKDTVPTLRREEWKALKAAAPDEKVRDCLQALRWTKGDLEKLYAAREAQHKKRETKTLAHA